MRAVPRSVLGWCCLVVLLFAVGCRPRIDRAIAAADELRGTQQYEAALRSYDLVLERFPKNPKGADVLLRIGDVNRFHLQRRTEAAAAYRRISTQWPLQPAAMTAYLRLAEMAEEGADYTGAVEALEFLLQYFPAYPERDQLRHRIGTLYMKQRLFPQARFEFERLLNDTKLLPVVRTGALFDMGETFFLSGNPQAAIRYYDQLLTEFPAHPLATRALAQKAEAYAELGELGVALELQRRAGAMAAQATTTASAPAAPAVMAAPAPRVVTVTLQAPGGKPIVVEAEVAATEAERERGLMGRRELADGHGMWFIFPQTTEISFWMKNTPLSLDLLFVDEAGTIVDILPETKPLSEKPLTPQSAYRYVLEVPAGFLRKYLIAVGSHLEWAAVK
ncbi:MAG: DUF192 domain-containing protein [Deltaproteobacteria bacterium]|nr:DUF192 domain-containing protein [Deltaproteobacteria bacterium]